MTFFHVCSPEAHTLPMIMTHGWPGSVIEFNRVVGSLTDPVAHGGDTRDAFRLVLPRLPGYGFSERPAATGWTVDRTVRAWSTLMAGLGDDRWVAHGGGWGASVTKRIAGAAAPGCAAIHLNTVNIASDLADADDDSPDTQPGKPTDNAFIETFNGLLRDECLNLH